MPDRYRVRVKWPDDLYIETFGPMDRDAAELMKEELSQLGATVTIVRVVK